MLDNYKLYAETSQYRQLYAVNSQYRQMYAVYSQYLGISCLSLWLLSLISLLLFCNVAYVVGWSINETVFVLEMYLA